MDNPSRPRTLRRALATVLTGALFAGAAVLGAAAPATAAEQEVEGGELLWGFRQNFRQYVGNQTAALPPIGAVPHGQRITLIEPAQFDPNGRPAIANAPSNPNETLPYILPVSAGSVTDPDNLTVQTAGGAVYHFPSHYFTATVKDVAVKISDGVAQLVGDLAIEIEPNDAGYPEGIHGGDDIVIGEVASVDVDLDGDRLTVSGSGVTLTAAGAAALQDFLQEGSALDDFTLSTTVADPGPGTPASVAVSKTSGLNPEGDTVTVTGSGFTDSVLGTRPPVAGIPAGFYVAFGKYADPWQPSEGAPSGNRLNGPNGTAVKWVVPQESYESISTNFPSVANQLVLLNPDGSFELELSVAEALGGFTAETGGTYGVYTYAAGGVVHAPFETATPLAFGDATDINVTVPGGTGEPEEPETGSFGWAFASQAPASLGTAAVQGANFVATGALTEIVVTDTRAGGSGGYSWSISGQVGDFASGSNSFGGGHLGWTPKLVEGGASVTKGADVTSTTLGGTGLGASSVLAQSNAAASARLGADLQLVIPGTTPAGDYTAKLTITALH
ncbi:HtaA domain-containing protein [Microbacterium album]|uniref:Htaa domain-containing protein n=1 Tax=Microbacterium album TaxID=2053191 RepID=A0A917IHB2_9MICO|nr:HtaA domain-containing protein [Microbacterium album]GGH51380.1 hypothetical protein GCM10010921_30740 [Microbacterium album]